MQSLTDRTAFELVPQLIIEKDEAIHEEFNKDIIVRIAKVEVDPMLNDAYRSVTLDTLITSMDTEEEMLACYAGRLQRNNHHWRIVEIFKDHDSFESHRESDAFANYLEEKEPMIIYREQFDLRADTLFNRGGIKFIYKKKVS
jgi:quinol monooxygenase YgiN